MISNIFDELNILNNNLSDFLFDEELSSEEEIIYNDLKKSEIGYNELIKKRIYKGVARPLFVAFCIQKLNLADDSDNLYRDLCGIDNIHTEELALSSAASGNKDVFTKALMQLLSDEENKKLTKSDFEEEKSTLEDKIQTFFCIALISCHSEILDIIYGQLEKRALLLDFFEFEQVGLFAAIEIGSNASIDLLASKSRVNISKLLTEDNFNAFSAAIESGQIETAIHLVNRFPELAKEMIAYRDYSAITKLAKKNEFKLLKRLIVDAPDLLITWFESKCFNVYLNSERGAEGDNFKIHAFLDEFEEYKNQLIQANEFNICLWPSITGDINLLNRLLDEYPHETFNKLKSDQFGSFAMAAEKGHVSIMRKLDVIGNSKVD